MEDHNLPTMLKYWSKLNETQQKVMVSLYEKIGFSDFAYFTHMHAAAAAGNVEAVCRYLSDDLAEQFRKG